jgi:hypothetical protein
MNDKSTFHETKEVTSRLIQPIKFKIKPYRYETKDKLVDGHQIEIEVNLAWTDIDNMKNKDGPIIQGISNCISLIENDLKSTYLGTVKN